MRSTRILALSLLALPSLVLACGEEVGSPDASAPQAQEDPHAGLSMPASSRPASSMPEPVPASFAGRIVLQGDLATRDGVLMVSACPKGSRLPLMSYLIRLEDAAPAVEGERVVPFRLDTSNDMMGGGGLPHDSSGMELELSVRFDADGKVETREGDVTVAVPAQPDATDLEVVLGG